MAVPRKKVSRQKRGNRRASHALKSQVLIADKETGSLSRPHHINLVTGAYRGHQVLDPKTV